MPVVSCSERHASTHARSFSQLADFPNRVAFVFTNSNSKYSSSSSKLNPNHSREVLSSRVNFVKRRAERGGRLDVVQKDRGKLQKESSSRHARQILHATWLFNCNLRRGFTRHERSFLPKGNARCSLAPPPGRFFPRPLPRGKNNETAQE